MVKMWREEERGTVRRRCSWRYPYVRFVPIRRHVHGKLGWGFRRRVEPWGIRSQSGSVGVQNPIIQLACGINPGGRRLFTPGGGELWGITAGGAVRRLTGRGGG